LSSATDRPQARYRRAALEAGLEPLGGGLCKAVG